MRRLLAIFLTCISSQALADKEISYKCIMNRHVILSDDRTREGGLNTFEITAQFDKLKFGADPYFEELELSLEGVADDYLRAVNDISIFIYKAGKFHFSFASTEHVTSISGDCLPISLSNES